MGIILALLLFGFIVFFHELGHFLLAKKNGIDVDEFSIGMGPLLVSKQYKETQYSLRLLPIGGFCAMGEDEEATDSPNNFNNKSVWARIAVIAAGAIFNFILAFILSVILVAMTGYDEPVISAVDENYPAAAAGIEAGDIITKLNDVEVSSYAAMVSERNKYGAGDTITVTIFRGGRTTTVEVTLAVSA